VLVDRLDIWFVNRPSEKVFFRSIDLFPIVEGLNRNWQDQLLEPV
jgi:hypothetical protein